MFCPACRTEYEENIEKCVDCGAKLVSELPEELPPEYYDYELILSTFNPADIAVIRSILDNSDLDYYFHGENSAFMQPFAVAARLMVRKDQADDARALLKDVPIVFTLHTREESHGHTAG